MTRSYCHNPWYLRERVFRRILVDHPAMVHSYNTLSRRWRHLNRISLLRPMDFRQDIPGLMNPLDPAMLLLARLHHLAIVCRTLGRVPNHPVIMSIQTEVRQTFRSHPIPMWLRIHLTYFYLEILRISQLSAMPPLMRLAALSTDHL